MNKPISIVSWEEAGEVVAAAYFPPPNNYVSGSHNYVKRFKTHAEADKYRAALAAEIRAMKVGAVRVPKYR